MDGRDAGALAALDALAQADMVRRGEVSAEELVTAAIARIETVNPQINAVVTPMADHALARVRGGVGGPLARVPYVLKDLVAEVAGVRFTEGARFLADYTSSYDSELVVRLQRAGLVIVGKTNTAEFGMLPACENALFGATCNPWDVTRSTSGSSGGSAAAVAAGLVPAGHGNDLGGSIRYPASACGLFGLKPSRARNPLGPTYGDAISGWACEHAITRTVRDSAAILDATAGPMPGDPYPAPAADGPFLSHVGADPGRLRIAFTPRTADGGLGHPDCVAALEDAVGLCGELGHELVEADLPGLDGATGQAIGTVFAAATAWIVGYWVRELGREPTDDEIDPLTRAYLGASAGTTAGDYLLAIEVLQRFARRVAEFLTGFDMWLTPTMSTPPLPLGEMVSTPDDPWRAAEAGGATVGYSAVVANITGNPAMSVPLWWNAEGLPIGVHFLGRAGGEGPLLRLAGQLERARPWADRRPPVHA